MHRKRIVTCECKISFTNKKRITDMVIGAAMSEVLTECTLLHSVFVYIRRIGGILHDWQQMRVKLHQSCQKGTHISVTSLWLTKDIFTWKKNQRNHCFDIKQYCTLGVRFCISRKSTAVLSNASYIAQIQFLFIWCCCYPIVPLKLFLSTTRRKSRVCMDLYLVRHQHMTLILEEMQDVCVSVTFERYVLDAAY